MNDFLDRLAAKAIGGEAALLPRLPSLFEPTSPRSAALPMNNSDDASATMAEPAPAVGMLSMDRQKPSSNETAANASWRSSPGSPQGLASDEASVGTLKAPRRADAPARPDVRAVSLGAEPDPTRRDMAGETVAWAQGSALPHSTRVTREQPHAADAPASNRAALLPRAMTSDLPGAESSVRPATPLPTRVAPALKREAGLAEATTVHVTIGRLEVRAAPPAAAARPRRQETAKQSGLDDYLRQRGDRAAP